VIFCLYSLAGYPLHLLVSPTLPLPCVTVCHQVSILLYPPSTSTRTSSTASGRCSLWTVFSAILTLRLLMSYICVCVYIYIYIYIYMELLVKPEILMLCIYIYIYIYGPTFCNAESHLFLFSAQCFNTESTQKVFSVSQLYVNTLPATNVTLITNGI
jgi:hypothetical protein